MKVFSEEVINELIDVLNEEYIIYKRILELSRKKTDTLLNDNINELDSITKAEQEMILAIGRCEDVRYKITKKVAQDFEEDIDNLTLNNILEKIPDNDGSKLAMLQVDLFDVLKEIDDVNKKNGELIKRTLKIIDENLSLFISSAESESIYGCGGKEVKGESIHFLDHKV